LYPRNGKSDLFGFLAGEFRVVGDIESPVVPLDQREVLRETSGKKTLQKAKKGKK
jgi:hypothetical protein